MWRPRRKPRSHHSGGTQKMRTGFAAVLACACLLAGPAAAQKSADTLRVTWRDAVPNVDPYYNTQRNGLVLADLGWDGLLYRNPDSNEVVPALATEWRQVDDTT